MSGFDVQMRTQEMTSGLQMEAGRRENEAVARIGNAAASLPEMVMRAQQARQSMQSEQQMMGLREREMMLNEAKSAAQIASWEQESQLNQYKLQQMMALDQAGLSRLQVEMAQEQLNGVRMQNRQAERSFQRDYPGQEFELKRREVEGSLFGQDPNFVLDPTTMRWRPIKDQDEYKKRQAEIKDRRTQTSRAEPKPITENPLDSPTKLNTALAQGYKLAYNQQSQQWEHVPASPEEVKEARKWLQESHQADIRERQAVDRTDQNTINAVKEEVRAIMDSLDQGVIDVDEAQRKLDVARKKLSEISNKGSAKTNSVRDDLIKLLSREDGK